MLANIFRVLIDHGFSEPLLRITTSLPLKWQKRLGLQPIRVRVR